MKTISEVGHAKNVANLEDLISYCTAFGSTYNPSLAALQLSSLAVLNATANGAITTMVNSVTNYKIAVVNRTITFKNLKLLAPRIISALKAAGASAQTLANAKAIYKKLLGRSKKTSSTIVPTSTKAVDNTTLPAIPVIKTISTSQQSFDSKIEFFTALVNLVNSVPSYTPNELDLNIAGLTSFLTQLKTVNTAVITTTTSLDAARTNRNHILYDAVTGLVVIAFEVKDYVASLYGKKSNEFKNINKIKFINIKS